ncbi:MAG: oligosaccharyl transferase, archaeosortase A system-associated [Halovenus sp.]
MSNWREQFGEGEESRAVLVWLERYYHYPIIGVLLLFAFWNRIRNWTNFVVGDRIYFRGNDPYYHLRQTQYAVENFPYTMPFDPWTQFPLGVNVGQFGTLFDQLIALGALLAGLGSPSEELVRQVFLLAPAFFVVPTVLVAYFLGKYLGGRFGGLVSVAIVAFAPDRFLSVSLAGNVQHESAELLFMGLGVLAVMIALTVAEREKPVYELVAAREFGELRGTIGWSMLAGVAMSLYLWVWPPGVWLFGILAVFFLVHLSIEHVRGRSPEHAAFVGVVSLVTAGLLQFAFIETLSLNVVSRTILHPGLAFVAGGGVVFLAWLSRQVERRDLPRSAYPAITFGLAIGGTALFALLLPDLFGFFVAQVDRVLGFVTSPGTAAGTIGEAQPIDIGDLADSYKLAGFTAIVGGVFLLLKQVFDEEPSGGELLFVVWGLFMLAATLTQLRFEYYLTLVVGGLNAALAGYVMALISPSDREVRIESYQVFTVAAIVLVIIVPMFLVSPTVIEWSDGQSQPANSVEWDDNLQWMNENTPEPGQYANPDGEPMELFGTFDETDDFEYPPGAYGVLSWWDYGHWITSEAERIPVANPFQQGVRDAADFLLSQNESEGLAVLESIDESDDARVEYVMVDWKMVQTDTALQGKFFAPVDFSGQYERSDFYNRIIDRQLTEQFGLVAGTSVMQHKQPYYDSMAVRLYKYHGSAKDPQPYVLSWEGTEQDLGGGDTFTSAPQNEPAIQFYDSMAQAREAAENSNTAQVGGIGPHPAERVPALEHFRLVHLGETSALSPGPGQRSGLDFDFQRTARNNNLSQRLVAEVPRYEGVEPTRALADFMFQTDPSWTKTFERVPGATIEGTTNPEAEVMLSVTLQPENGTQFTYRQRTTADEDGEFNATVPYATTGYGEWGPEEGYTDTNVRATGPYEVQSLLENETSGGIEAFEVGQVNVTEGQVLGEDNTPATVELESLTGEQNVTIEPGDGEQEGGNEDNGEADGGTEESTARDERTANG